MNKYFFIKNEFIRKFALTIFILIIFGMYSIASIVSLLLAIYLVLFRKRNLRIKDIRLSEEKLLLSPVSGIFEKEITTESTKTLVFKMKFYNSYGLYLPFSGEVLNTKEGLLTFQNKSNEKYSLKADGLFSINKIKYFVTAGDKGVIGGLLGYFPIGGKVYLEIPSHYDVLMKNGDRVFSSQSIMAKIKE